MEKYSQGRSTSAKHSKKNISVELFCPAGLISLLLIMTQWVLLLAHEQSAPRGTIISPLSIYTVTNIGAKLPFSFALEDHRECPQSPHRKRKNHLEKFLLLRCVNYCRHPSSESSKFVIHPPKLLIAAHLKLMSRSRSAHPPCLTQLGQVFPFAFCMISGLKIISSQSPPKPQIENRHHVKLWKNK